MTCTRCCFLHVPFVFLLSCRLFLEWRVVMRAVLQAPHTCIRACCTRLVASWNLANTVVLATCTHTPATPPPLLATVLFARADTVVLASRLIRGWKRWRGSRKGALNTRGPGHHVLVAVKVDAARNVFFVVLYFVVHVPFSVHDLGLCEGIKRAASQAQF